MAKRKKKLSCSAKVELLKRELRAADKLLGECSAVIKRSMERDEKLHAIARALKRSQLRWSV